MKRRSREGNGEQKSARNPDSGNASQIPLDSGCMPMSNRVECASNESHTRLIDINSLTHLPLSIKTEHWNEARRGKDMNRIYSSFSFSFPRNTATLSTPNPQPQLARLEAELHKDKVDEQEKQLRLVNNRQGSEWSVSD